MRPDATESVMELYRPYLHYKLFRALEDEGVPDDEMRFEQGLTFVNDLGFFTIIQEYEVPQVYHFLVWNMKREWPNGIRLYRKMRAVLIGMGHVQAIFASPDDKIKTVLGIVAGTKNIVPYAKRNGFEYYLLKFGRSL